MPAKNTYKLFNCGWKGEGGFFFNGHLSPLGPIRPIYINVHFFFSFFLSIYRNQVMQLQRKKKVGGFPQRLCWRMNPPPPPLLHSHILVLLYFENLKKKIYYHFSPWEQVKKEEGGKRGGEEEGRGDADCTKKFKKISFPLLGS